MYLCKKISRFQVKQNLRKEKDFLFLYPYIKRKKKKEEKENSVRGFIEKKILFFEGKFEKPNKQNDMLVYWKILIIKIQGALQEKSELETEIRDGQLSVSK